MHSTTSAAQQAVEGRRPHLVVTVTTSLSPVVKYHGLARRHLMPSRFLMRPLLNGGTLARPERGDRRRSCEIDEIGSMQARVDVGPSLMCRRLGDQLGFSGDC
jgi:hypothetical protein